MVAVPLVTAVAMERSASVPGAKVFSVSPKNGDKVTGPVKVVMGIDDMKIAPAGTDVPGTGHHHIIVDADKPALDKPIPSDDHHRHFGKGQTETTLDLAPGKHTLQLVLGDKVHVPHNPPVVRSHNYYGGEVTAGFYDISDS